MHCRGRAGARHRAFVDRCGGGGHPDLCARSIVATTDRLHPRAPDFTGAIGSGTFAFDSAAIRGIGNEVVGAGDLSLDLTLFGQRFTERDDTSFRTYPALLLTDGVPRAMDFFVREAGRNPVPIDEPFLAGFFANRIVPLGPAGPDAFVVRLTAISAVPLPPALALLLAGGVVLALVGRRSLRLPFAGAAASSEVTETSERRWSNVE